MGPFVKVAVVQSEPVWWDLKGTVAKVNKLIKEAYESGAELIAFPEVFVPGYPVWIWSKPADSLKNANYIDNSLSYDSPEFQSIIDTIKSNPIHVVLGLSERDHDSIYISQCIIDKHGQVVLKRRKIKPTHVERILYGDGRSSDLKSVATLDFKEAGPVEVGCLSCWEHQQPLLSYNSAAQHEKIHIGSWPAVNDKCDGENPWCFTKEGFYALSRAYSQQTQSFYLFSSQLTSEKLQESIPDIDIVGMTGRGTPASAVFQPDGYLASDTSFKGDGLIIHDLDMHKILIQKHFIDIVGHYSRPDMMSLAHHHVNEDVKNYITGPTN
ncbi:Nitrilase 2 [Wickerhamomyces ciferrii]|uniref:nitrilase n=1 Tax=Wickerhamomyces ciferrii (strain ATCC 14091 / BCRC 22168 / CBS 111 / JCM 3599 / NBRC 0793 / NRRL Y-1031 F-60-10) TaxID=1206466 RepID=K0KQW3_WICCF|nr:Nitrilase 2 [Wickerhamomyces ciferrii]CCH43709.1 Nitrilase 2 [Wickerhamomyces ciferrii]